MKDAHGRKTIRRYNMTLPDRLALYVGEIT